MSAIARAGAASHTPATDQADLAALAVSKALRVQRQQADAMISLIQQATSTADIGRVISVRA